MTEEEKTIQEEVSLQILIADRIIKSSQEAESSKVECSELAKQAIQLAQLLRSTVRLYNTSTQSLYQRPLRRICSEISKNLEKTLTLVRKFKHTGLLRHVFSITTTADFRKVSALLESSIADLKWLLSIFDSESGTNLSLPPIASNDPILAWVWSSIAALQTGHFRDRVEAANELASLARDNNRNKQIIVQEGGISPLLKLLKEGGSVSPEAQIASANALYCLATDKDRVRLIANELAVPIIVQVLGESVMKVQILLVKLVERMVEMDCDVQEEFGTQNVTRPLVTLLSMDVVLDVNTTRIHSVLQKKKQMLNSTLGNSFNLKKDREVESSEVKNSLKICCAGALWKLAKGSLLNSRKITETKALLCLAKLIEKERGELQIYCLMTVMELAKVAECNADLRRSAFKTTSPAARAVLEQLLKVVNVETSPPLLVPAIRTMGLLARTFPAKEIRIIGPLVAQLGHKSADVSTEAAIALGKFVSLDNFNCVEHSKSVIEFDGVPRLISLVKGNEKGQVHELVLLCYLAIHVGNSQALEQARALNVIEGAARSVITQSPDLRELFGKAIHQLTLYQAGAHSHRHSYVP